MRGQKDKRSCIHEEGRETHGDVKSFHDRPIQRSFNLEIIDRAYGVLTKRAQVQTLSEKNHNTNGKNKMIPEMFEVKKKM